jgi:threonine synthase
MDWELVANRHGHIACTQGGESLAGLVKAAEQGIVDPEEVAVVDSTAHALKFSGFQDMYFSRKFPSEFGILPDPELINSPVLVRPGTVDRFPEPDRPLSGEAFQRFVQAVTREIAQQLHLKKSRAKE